MKPADFDTTILRLKEQSAMAILALQDGSQTFELEHAPGSEIEALLFLQGAVDWFYSHDEHEFIDGIVSQMRGPELKYAESMLLANIETQAGRLDSAIDHYEDARRVESQSHHPVQQLAHLLVERKRIDEAIETYQAALKLAEGTEDELAIRLQLSEHQMARKNFSNAVANHDRILELQPDLATNKALAKQIAKAKKKAGV